MKSIAGQHGHTDCWPRYKGPQHLASYWSQDGQWRYENNQWVSNLSPDGQFVWNGLEWEALVQVAPTPSNLSPDGLWRFDGTNWVPATPWSPAQPVQAGGAHGVGVKFTQVPIPKPAPATKMIGVFAIIAVVIVFVVTLVVAMNHNNGGNVDSTLYYLHYNCRGAADPTACTGRGAIAEIGVLNTLGVTQVGCANLKAQWMQSADPAGVPTYWCSTSTSPGDTGP